MDHEDDLVYSKSVWKGSIKGSIGHSVKNIKSNSKDGSDSNRFKRIGMNRAKLGTPQFEDKQPDWPAATTMTNGDYF